MHCVNIVKLLHQNKLIKVLKTPADNTGSFEMTMRVISVELCTTQQNQRLLYIILAPCMRILLHSQCCGCHSHESLLVWKAEYM